MGTIIIGLVSIILSWAVFYLFALVADSISNKWMIIFFVAILVYTVVLPFWIFDSWSNSLAVSFVGFLVLALGEKVLRAHASAKKDYEESVIQKIQELENTVKEFQQQQKYL